jgi:hypothetical protein
VVVSNLQTFPQVTRAEILRRFPNATESFITANLSPGVTADKPDVDGLRSKKPEHHPGRPLDRPLSGETSGGWRPGDCAYIEFHVYALQPPDWDNAFLKPIQDLLIEIGLLASDKWDQLQGRVIPHQVKKKNQERTEVKIWYC